MQVFRADEHHTNKIVPRTKQKIWPVDPDGNPIIYARGMLVSYIDNTICLSFNFTEAFTVYTKVTVEIKNLTTDEDIPISQEIKRQKILLEPDQNYQVIFIGQIDPDKLTNSEGKFVYDFEPD